MYSFLANFFAKAYNFSCKFGNFCIRQLIAVESTKINNSIARAASSLRVKCAVIQANAVTQFNEEQNQRESRNVIKDAQRLLK